MKLYELIKDTAETVLDDIEISSVTDDTRKVFEPLDFLRAVFKTK